MKHIMLLRHAKSSWEDSGLDDFDRPLAKRGIKDAQRMGNYARETRNVPDLVISSPAERAKQTTQLFSEAAGITDQHIQWEEDFYYGSCFDYFNALKECPEEVETAMLVGHNPKMEEMVSLLSSDHKNYIARMPTAALVCFEHPAIEWGQIKEGTARVKWMVTPKLLKKLQ